MPAIVEAIYIAAEKRVPLTAVVEVLAIAGLGLQGDRYASGQGTFSKPVEEGDAGKQVTLIEAEAIDATLAESGADYRHGRSRRNLVTRGVSLNELVNCRLRIGDVLLRGDRLCPPCGHLSTLTSTDARTTLKHRGGLRTTVLQGGTIRVGDEIVVLPGLRDL